MRYWWLFIRYGLSIDLYMAQRSMNKETEVDCRCRIAEIDRRLDIIEINGGRA